MRTRNLIFFAVLSALIIFVPFSEYGTTCLAQDTELYPVRVNGKEGYIDATGRIVITPQFSSAHFFSEGLACVSSKEGFAWIDRTGKQVIAPQFNCITGEGAFHEGLAVICVGDRKGYIDKTGKIVINPQFDTAWPFSEGLASVGVGVSYDGQIGFIDRTGRFVINPQFNYFFTEHEFSEGLLCVKIEKGDFGTYRFLDNTGQDYFNYPFDDAHGFSEGLACVRKGNQRGFIDKSGKFVFYCPKDGYYHPFKEGMSRFSISKYEYVDGEDYPVLTEEKTGFINMAGKCVIEPYFYEADDFSEGVACVRIGGKYGKGRYGFVDKSGSFTINPQYDYADSFRGGIAPVVINNQFQYINKNGDIIWTSMELPSYISSSIEGVIRMEEYNKYRK